MLYTLITPVRDDAENLERLATCVAEQTMLPKRWIIVDNGSVDGTGPRIEGSLRSTTGSSCARALQLLSRSQERRSSELSTPASHS